jgi:predicted O-methyltransferase YrrM
LKLIKVGGFILIDNTLWHGAVIDQSKQDADTLVCKTKSPTTCSLPY